MDKEKAERFIVFQGSRKITDLYKSFLRKLESLRNQKVIGAVEYTALRKSVLDAGNDAIRGFEQEVNQFFEAI